VATARSRRPDRSGRARVLYVTGKGGAGKTSVASLLAAGCASHGETVALVGVTDVVDPSTIDRSTGVDAGVHCITLDERHALHHLLTHLLKFRMLSDRLMDSRTFSSVAAAAPGVKDLVYLSYLRELADGRTGSRFDTVVVDAPASGHSVPLLEAPRRVLELVPIGPIARIAREADALVRDHRHLTAVIVTLPEELGVTETLELHRALRGLDVAVAPIVINGVYPERLTSVQRSWLDEHGGSSDALLHAARRRRQLELLEPLRSLAGAESALHLLPFDFGAGRTNREAAVELADRVVSRGR
jgi:anion-transporting  ArsA/GET3 family ATPase